MNVMILGRAIQGVGESFLSSALTSVILSNPSVPDTTMGILRSSPLFYSLSSAVPPVCVRYYIGLSFTPLLHTSRRLVLPLFCSPLCHPLSSVCPASLSQTLHWVPSTPLPLYSLSSVCPRYYTGLVYTPLLHTSRRFGAIQGVGESKSFLFSALLSAILSALSISNLQH
jgi:hypothetical protein